MLADSPARGSCTELCVVAQMAVISKPTSDDSEVDEAVGDAVDEEDTDSRMDIERVLDGAGDGNRDSSNPGDEDAERDEYAADGESSDKEPLMNGHELRLSRGCGRCHTRMSQTSRRTKQTKTKALTAFRTTG